MKMSEVEKLLNVSRANIRYYEKEGLLHPDRSDNGYREYSDSDILRLKEILVFRKMGLSIDTIRGVLSGGASLRDAVADRAEQLKEQIEELNGALEICEEIAECNLELEAFDADKFWKKISDAEANGKRFASTIRDIIDFGQVTLDKAAEEDISDVLNTRTPVMQDLDKRQKHSTYFVWAMVAMLIFFPLMHTDDTLPGAVTMTMTIVCAVLFLGGILYSIRISRLRSKIRTDQFRRYNERTRMGKQ